VKAWETSVAETRIGGLVLKGQDYRVFDFSDMRHVFGSQVFDGIIGLTVFTQAVVRVDSRATPAHVHRSLEVLLRGRGRKRPSSWRGSCP
jgi:hypothetical protein